MNYCFSIMKIFGVFVFFLTVSSKVWFKVVCVCGGSFRSFVFLVVMCARVFLINLI